MHFSISQNNYKVLYDASSNLFPDQVCPPWQLFVNGTATDPLLSNNKLIIVTSQKENNVYYRQEAPIITIPDSFVLEARLKFISGTSSHQARAPIMITILTEPYKGNSLCINQDEIFLLSADMNRGQFISIDTDNGFHTYLIKITSGKINIIYDGKLVLKGTTFYNPNAANFPMISWGEASSLAYGTSEWEYIKHNVHSVGTIGGQVRTDGTNLEGVLIKLLHLENPMNMINQQLTGPDGKYSAP